VAGGAAAVAVVLGTSLAAYAVSPTAKATPTTNLVNGTKIKVTGTKWPKNDKSIAIVECNQAVLANPAEAHCRISGTGAIVITSSGATGVLKAATFKAYVGTVGDGSCGTAGHLTCYLTVADVASMGAIHAPDIKLTFK